MMRLSICMVIQIDRRLASVLSRGRSATECSFKILTIQLKLCIFYLTPWGGRFRLRVFLTHRWAPRGHSPAPSPSSHRPIIPPSHRRSVAAQRESAMLQIRDLNVTYHNTISAVQGVSLEVPDR